MYIYIYILGLSLSSFSKAMVRSGGVPLAGTISWVNGTIESMTRSIFENDKQIEKNIQNYIDFCQKHFKNYKVFCPTNAIILAVANTNNET